MVFIQPIIESANRYCLSITLCQGMVEFMQDTGYFCTQNEGLFCLEYKFG